jgi:hypothetical protein
MNMYQSETKGTWPGCLRRADPRPRLGVGIASVWACAPAAAEHEVGDVWACASAPTADGVRFGGGRIW